MSFLVTLALALAIFVAAPIAAHFLRKGKAREQEFPPAALVPVLDRSARSRSRLEDRWLLLLRALLIAVLSLLAAVPFVRCERLALDRDAGASVALALVLDDSLSMRSRTESGSTRWEDAQKAARDLVASTREGDAVGIVLGGTPARLALAATTDLRVVRETLDKLKPEDRATDLTAAVRLAQSALKGLPHVDKRVAILSDFAADSNAFARDEGLWIPLEELQKGSQNCGIVEVQRQARRVVARVACSSARAARGRQLRLVGTADSKPNINGPELYKAALQPQAGTQHLELSVPETTPALDAFLSGTDDLEQDNYAAVATVQGSLLIGVVADPANAAATGATATVIEQALAALADSNGPSTEQPAEVRPLPLVPEDAKELSAYAALIIDDPPGLTAEARNALAAWLATGGSAAAFLGPNVEAAQLGGGFEPFAEGALTWESTKASGISGARELLGDAGASLTELAPSGRLRMTHAQQEGASVVLRWDDDTPWMLERKVGRGQVWTLGLPVSVDHSDLALRPGFLALLERFVFEAAQNNGQRVTEAGSAWRLPDSVESVTGPSGKLELPPARDTALTLSPAIRGRYRILDRTESTHERIVIVNEREVVAQPKPVATSHTRRSVANKAPNVDVSREFALLLLALIALELALRLAARLHLRQQNPV